MIPFKFNKIVVCVLAMSSLVANAQSAYSTTGPKGGSVKPGGSLPPPPPPFNGGGLTPNVPSMGGGNPYNTGSIESLSVSVMRTLLHADVVPVLRSVRPLMSDESVSSISIVVQSVAPGSSIEVISNQTVVSRQKVGKNLITLSVALSSNINSLQVRAIGSVYIQTISVDVRRNYSSLPSGPGHVHPGHPNMPPPAPPYGSPHMPNMPWGASLQGFCADYDHTQFVKAKEFAYSSSGLDKSSSGATEWALNYNNTHACNTISEYISRFAALKSFAYSSSGLDKSSSASVAYALSRVETTTVKTSAELISIFSVVKDFAYSSSGLDLSRTAAIKVATEWMDRGYCEDKIGLQAIIVAYKKDYNFASSSSGLNYSRTKAKQYALDRIRYMSRCGDVLSQ